VAVEAQTTAAATHLQVCRDGYKSVHPCVHCFERSRATSQSKAFGSDPTTTLPTTTIFCSYHRSNTTTLFAVTTDQTKHAPHQHAAKWCRLFCASLMQALCDTLRLNARVRWVSLTSRSATTCFCSGLCGGVQSGFGLSQIQQVPEPNPVWLIWAHARHVKLLLHAATDVAVFSFLMLLGLMPHHLLCLLACTFDLTVYNQNCKSQLVLAFDLTRRFVLACRAALVLASAADQLGSLLRSKGKGQEDTRLVDTILIAALLEARYAVRFMMESLWPSSVMWFHCSQEERACCCRCSHALNCSNYGSLDGGEHA
jgi:hypothetical protein